MWLMSVRVTAGVVEHPCMNNNATNGIENKTMMVIKVFMASPKGVKGYFRSEATRVYSGQDSVFFQSAV